MGKITVFLNLIISAFVGCVHFGMLHSYHSVNNNLPIQQQKIMGLHTENGFYYSFYDRFVHAPNFIDGLLLFYDDRISEHPHSINALARFNVYQEMLIGILYRSFGFLFMAPWDFFGISLCIVVGIGGFALTYIASRESGSIFCGLTSFALYFLNLTEVTRVWYPNSTDLREFWALPILWIQILTVLNALRQGPGLNFIISTFMFVLLWQFGSYLMVLQASSIFIVYLLGYMPGEENGRLRFRKIIDYYIIATGLTILALFGNWLLVTNIFLSMLIGIRITVTIPRSILANEKYPMLLKAVLQGALAVIIFVAIRIALKPYANADSHIFEIICARVDWLQQNVKYCPPTKSFNARLYLVMGVFNLITEESIKQFRESTVFYSCATTMVIIPLAVVMSCLFGGIKQQPKKERDSKSSADSNKSKKDDIKKKDIVQDEDETRTILSSWIFLWSQQIFFTLLGIFINRLRAVFGPPMCVMAGMVFAPYLWEHIRIPVRIPKRIPLYTVRIPKIISLSASLIYFAYLCTKLPCGENGNIGICDGVRTYSDSGADVIEMTDFMNRHLEPTEAVATSISLSGQIRAHANVRTIVHPHYEDQALRERVQDLYENLYHCLPPVEANKKLRKLHAKYLIIELSRCSLSPYELDPPRISCVQGHDPKMAQKLLCRTIMLEPKYFKIRFINGGYMIFERLDIIDEKLPTYKSFGSEQLWKDVVDQCEELEECSGRLSEAAIQLVDRMGLRDAGKTLITLVFQKFKDPVAYYYQGRFGDYIEKKKGNDIKKFYKKALDGSPEDYFFNKEYILYNDMVLEDVEEGKRQSKKVLGLPRDDNNLEWWSLRLEVAVSLKDEKKYKKEQYEFWEEIKARNPMLSTVKEYWNFFQKGNVTRAEEFKPWNLVKYLMWDRNLKSQVNSVNAVGFRLTRKGNEWKTMYED